MSKQPSMKIGLGQVIAGQFRGLTGDVGLWPLLPKLGLLIIAAIVIEVAAWYLFWDGQLGDIEKAKAQEVVLKDEFKEKKKRAVTLDARREQLEEIGRTFGALLKQLPKKSEVSALLVEVNQAGLGHGLQFELFKPQAEKTLEFYAELPVTVRLSGSYHDFGAFTNDVAKLSRIVTVNDMDIKLPTGLQSNAIVKDGSKEGVLTMDTVVKTFRYLDQSEIVITDSPAGQ